MTNIQHNRPLAVGVAESISSAQFYVKFETYVYLLHWMAMFAKMSICAFLNQNYKSVDHMEDLDPLKWLHRLIWNIYNF